MLTCRRVSASSSSSWSLSEDEVFNLRMIRLMWLAYSVSECFEICKSLSSSAMGQCSSSLCLARVILVEMNFLRPRRFERFKLDQSEVGSSVGYDPENGSGAFFKFQDILL